MKKKIAVFWFRRDLRLDDNTGFLEALKGKYPVLPIFIFDTHILDHLPKNDARITFIFETLQKMRSELQNKHRSSLSLHYSTPKKVFETLISKYEIQQVYTNHDYEPYAKEREIP